MSPGFVPGVQGCPHCMARVVILNDGICPRCQGNCFDTAMIDLDRTSVWVYEKDVIPSLCHRCGRSADRRISVSYTRAQKTPNNEQPRSEYWGLVVVFGFLGGFLIKGLIRVVWRLLGQKTNDDVRQYETVSVKIPECRDCRQGDVEPITASIPDGALKLAVHRRFAEEHECLNNL
ncbi:MAG: hypothetical protein O2856_08440 [Planctomycetota bacterium]|nr:hypothetical protein [Planctomycetota bacterium]